MVFENKITEHVGQTRPDLATINLDMGYVGNSRQCAYSLFTNYYWRQRTGLLYTIQGAQRELEVVASLASTVTCKVVTDPVEEGS